MAMVRTHVMSILCCERKRLQLLLVAILAFHLQPATHHDTRLVYALMQYDPQADVEAHHQVSCLFDSILSHGDTGCIDVPDEENAIYAAVDDGGAYSLSSPLRDHNDDIVAEDEEENAALPSDPITEGQNGGRSVVNSSSAIEDDRGTAVIREDNALALSECIGRIVRSLQCPITLDVFKQPVLASDGWTYEESIMPRLSTSPILRNNNQGRDGAATEEEKEFQCVGTNHGLLEFMAWLKQVSNDGYFDIKTWSKEVKCLEGLLINHYLREITQALQEALPLVNNDAELLRKRIRDEIEKIPDEMKRVRDEIKRIRDEKGSDTLVDESSQQTHGSLPVRQQQHHSLHHGRFPALFVMLQLCERHRRSPAGNRAFCIALAGTMSIMVILVFAARVMSEKVAPVAIRNEQSNEISIEI